MIDIEKGRKALVRCWRRSGHANECAGNRSRPKYFFQNKKQYKAAKGHFIRLVFARLKMNKEEMKALGAVRSVRSHKTPILSRDTVFLAAAMHLQCFYGQLQQTWIDERPACVFLKNVCCHFAIEDDD